VGISIPTCGSCPAVPAFEIGSRIYFFDRDPDPDQKSFRKNRGSIFMLNSISDFHFKIDQRFPDQNRIRFTNLPASPGHIPDHPPPGSREGCAKRSPKSPPIACFSGLYDNISAENGTPFPGIGHFSPRFPF
jgi:hypothetical protein